MNDIVLIYPNLGSQDSLLRDIPLSLLYAAAHSVKHNFQVKIFDCRLYPETWREELGRILDQGCLLVGISVMTGHPILTSLEISKYVKENYDVSVVWGGPHPTILPEETLKNKYIDYIIRDWGSKPLHELISSIKDKTVRLEEITGLGFKINGKIFLNEATCGFEMLDYHDIPYELVDINSDNYNRLQGENVFFPIYTSVGCPYQCAFCMSPSVYKKIKGKKWVPYDIIQVIDHIEYLLYRYAFQRLQIYDDDSFVNIERMRAFFKEYLKRGLHKKLILDFRGARINELDKMDDEFLNLMVRARVEVLAIGVESGSDETLQRMKKGITVEQIIRVNQKLSKFQTLRPHYNILCGTPGETYEDLLQTKEIMERLVKDNPVCFVGAAGDWKPYPGSLMTEVAQQKYGLKLPQSLEAWADLDSLDAGKISHPWYTKKIDNYIKLLQIAGQLMDSKIEYLEEEMSSGRSSMMKIYIFLAKMYRPILKFRLRYNFASFIFEHDIRTFIMKLAGKLH